MLGRIFSILGLILLIYLVYVFAKGILPYLKYEPRKVTQDQPDWIETKDRITLVDDIWEAWLARLDFIDYAEESLDIAYFAFHGGRSVTIYLSYLLEAANRGVKIRLLVDGLSHGLWGHTDIVETFKAHPNIEVRFYHPPHPLQPAYWHDRMHEKIMIVDGKIAMIGGRNVGNKYFTDKDIPNVSIDRDVLVFRQEESGIFPEIEKYFHNLWTYKYTRKTFNHIFSKKSQAGEKQLRELYNEYSPEAPNKLDQIDWFSRSFPIHRAYYVHNTLEPGFKEPLVWDNMLKLMSESKESVFIQTPYVIPSEGMLKDWADAIGDGVDLGVLTNNMNSSNNVFAYAGHLNHRERMLKSDMTVIEYQPKTSQLHTKLFIFDQRISAVGTFNLDQRSTSLAAESMLVVDSPEFTEHLIKELSKRYLVFSWHVDQANKDETEASPRRQFFYRIARPLAKLFEGLL